MEKLKEITSKIGIGLFVLAFLFFGLKGCVVTVWNSPSEPTTYAVHGADGRSLSMIFMPKNETFILYSNQETDYIEATLNKMRGTYGTHYFWRLWSIEGPDVGLFGYRIYPGGSQPIVMETTVLDKFVHGNDSPSLRNKGDRTHPVILFSENAVRFEDMWLQKEPTDINLLTVLSQRLSATKTE